MPQYPCYYGNASSSVEEFRTCYVVSANKADWIMHDQTHEQHEQWICPICGRTFNSRENMKNHLSAIHKNDDCEDLIDQWHVRKNHQLSFFCPGCDSVLYHGFQGLDAINCRFAHLLQHLKNPQGRRYTRQVGPQTYGFEIVGETGEMEDTAGA